MKRYPESSPIYIFIVLIVVILLPSCVAKKKFVAMEESRNRADQRVRELTAEVGQYEKDFNNYKNEFHYNNNVKNTHIDSLSKMIVGLNKDLMSRSENIDDQLFSFQVEKRRLNQLLSEKEIQIRDLNRELTVLRTQTDEQSNATQDLRIKLRNAESELSASTADAEIKGGEINTLKSTITSKNKEINRLNQTLKEKNEEIEKLKNQVSLLKSQFGQ